MHDCIRLYDDVFFEENMKNKHKDGTEYESIQES